MKRWLTIGSIAVGAMIVVGLLVIHQASDALRQAADDTAAQRDSSYDEIRLDRVPPPGYESMGAPAQFQDAAFFQGRIYLCAPSGLYAYDTKGALQARYRPGFELPATRLVAVAAARELFIATDGEGLLVFDGQAFRQIRPRAAGARTLTTILPLETGRVLLGTPKAGVLVYDGQKISAFHESLTAIHVTALAGNDGDLWVGTMDRGVLHYRGGQTQAFAEKEGLPDPQVLSLAVSGQSVYVGTPVGVAEFAAGKLRRTLASGFMARALLPHDKNLSIGTLDEGMIEVPLDARPSPGARPISHSVPNRVERLLQLEGVLYALGQDGLYRDDRAVLAREEAALDDTNVSALALDSAGRVWVGYFDRGLDILENGRPRHVEDEHAFCVNRIVPDPSRSLTAVATANGLMLFDSAARLREVMGRDQGLISNHVTDIALRPGGMTIATPAGITFIDGQGVRSISAFHGLVNNHVYTLAGSGATTLVGTLGGISVLDGDRPGLRYTTSNSLLKHNWITAIVQAGAEWFIGEYGGGIARMDADGHITVEESGFEVNPNAMLATPTRVYAGTLGRGLYVYDRASRRWHVSLVGLPSANVTALAARDGMVYIGTDNGLVRVREEALQ